MSKEELEKELAEQKHVNQVLGNAMNQISVELAQTKVRLACANAELSLAQPNELDPKQS